jgi:hypothetical protein
VLKIKRNNLNHYACRSSNKLAGNCTILKIRY